MLSERQKEAHIAELEDALKHVDNLDRFFLHQEINNLRAHWNDDAFFNKRIDAWEGE